MCILNVEIIKPHNHLIIFILIIKTKFRSTHPLFEFRPNFWDLTNLYGGYCITCRKDYVRVFCMLVSEFIKRNTEQVLFSFENFYWAAILGKCYSSLGKRIRTLGIPLRLLAAHFL